MLEGLHKHSVHLWLYRGVTEWRFFPHKRSLAEYRQQLAESTLTRQQTSLIFAVIKLLYDLIRNQAVKAGTQGSFQKKLRFYLAKSNIQSIEKTKLQMFKPHKQRKEVSKKILNLGPLTR